MFRRRRRPHRWGAPHGGDCPTPASRCSSQLRTFRSWLAIPAALALGACSVHPIPDDVSPIPTEEIVRSARCEMRLGLFDQVKRLLVSKGVRNFDVEALQTHAGRVKILAHIPPELSAILDEYGKVAVAYDFEFEITEHDNADGSLAFRLPFFTAPNAFDLGAAG